VGACGKPGSEYGQQSWRPRQRPEFEKFYKELEANKISLTGPRYKWWGPKHRAAYGQLLCALDKKGGEEEAKKDTGMPDPERMARMNRNRVRRGFEELEPWQEDLFEKGPRQGGIIRSGKWMGLTIREAQESIMRMRRKRWGSQDRPEPKEEKPKIDRLRISQDVSKLMRLAKGFTSGSDEEKIKNILQKHIDAGTIGNLINIWKGHPSVPQDDDDHNTLINMVRYELDKTWVDKVNAAMWSDKKAKRGAKYATRMQEGRKLSKKQLQKMILQEMNKALSKRKR
jgi:hypothetical protein